MEPSLLLWRVTSDPNQPAKRIFDWACQVYEDARRASARSDQYPPQVHGAVFPPFLGMAVPSSDDVSATLRERIVSELAPTCRSGQVAFIAGASVALVEDGLADPIAVGSQGVPTDSQASEAVGRGLVSRCVGSW